MSEPQDLKDSLARAVADEPPLAFDPDALITRAQREVRRRRTLIAVGAATAMVVLVAIIVPAALGRFRGAGHVSAAASGPVLTTVDSTPAPAAAALPRTYTAAELLLTSRRFTTEILDVMPKVVPGAGDLSVQAWATGDGPGITPGPGQLHTVIQFRLKDYPIAIELTVADPGAGQYATPQQDCAAARVSGVDCQLSHPATGQTLLVKREPSTGAQLTVVEYRPDGSTVSAAGFDYYAAGGNPGQYASGPLVTSAQLLMLVTQPGFRFG